MRTSARRAAPELGKLACRIELRNYCSAENIRFVSAASKPSLLSTPMRTTLTDIASRQRSADYVRDLSGDPGTRQTVLVNPFARPRCKAEAKALTFWGITWCP